MCSEPVWFEMAKGLPAAFVALVVGVIASWIALQQWRVGRAKFKLDLFERRYKIFDTTWAFLSEVSNRAGITKEVDEEFRNLTPQAEFLFGSDISAYIREAQRKQMKVRMLRMKFEANNAKSADDENEFMALNTWFLEQATEGCRTKFAPYLDFSNWR